MMKDEQNGTMKQMEEKIYVHNTNLYKRMEK
jgi:hypothetical protein